MSQVVDYGLIAFLCIAVHTLSSENFVLERRADDTMTLALFRASTLAYLNRLRDFRKAKQVKTRKANIDALGIIRLVGVGLIEQRGKGIFVVTVRGFGLAHSIYIDCGSIRPSGRVEWQKARKIMNTLVGSPSERPIAPMFFDLLDQIAELEATNEELDARATTIQQLLEERQAADEAADARRQQAEQAQASLARTQSIQTVSNQTSTPTRSTRDLPPITPVSLPGPSRSNRGHPVEPVTPSRPGQSSNQLSLGFTQAEETATPFDYEPAPVDDSLPGSFGPASPPPTPGPSNPTNIHAQCEERQRELEGQLQATVTRAEAAEGVLSAITRQGMAYLGFGQR